MVETPLFSLAEYTVAARSRVDAALAGYLDGLPSGCPLRLAEAMRYSLLAPGKRLRPVLVLLACEACGGHESDALPAACAVEMVHAYSLIHDDLPAMDDDDLRRGRPTCHKQFDEATAILAGDGLLTLAFEVLANDMLPPERGVRCCLELAKAAGVANLVGGQADDLNEPAAEGSVSTLEHIHRRKTGALIRAALRLGGLAADASETALAALDAYGDPLGLAFQVVDDLLDVSGDESHVGKRLGKDAENGKLTYPGLIGIEQSQRRAAELIDSAVAALASLGERAVGLKDLARFVLCRNQ